MRLKFNLTKKDYKSALNIIKKVGAVDYSLNVTYPSCVFINPIDYQKLRNESRVSIKSFYNTRQKLSNIESILEFDLFMYGPVENNKVKPGTVELDLKKLAKENKTLALAIHNKIFDQDLEDLLK